MPAKKLPLSSIEIREISLAALVAEKTLVRALIGRPIRGLTRERIRRELANRGLLSLLVPEGRR